MAHIQIIAKDGQQVLLNATSNQVAVSVPSVVQIQADINNVAQIKRVGNNAIVILKDGEKIVIENFFTVSATSNALVFQSPANQLTWVQFTKNSSSAQTVYYENIDSIQSLLDSSFLPHIEPWGYVLGGVALAGGVAVALSSSGGDSNSSGNTKSIVITQNNADGLVGKGQAGSTIEILLQNGTKQTTTVNASGNWSIQPNPIAENQKASITEKQADGTTIASTEVSRGDDAPATPTGAANVTDDQAPIVGNVSNNSTTNDNLPRLSGTATQGDIITIYDNGTAIGSTTVAVNGSWSFTPSLALSSGKHVLSYTAKDTTGHESGKSPTITINVDSEAAVAPSNAPTITDDQAPYIGNLTNGSVTNDTKPTIGGSGVAGEVVKIYVDNVVAASVTVASNGNWSYTPTNNIANGTYVISYTTTDLAGNESVQSPQITITIDSIAPVMGSDLPIVTDNTAPVLGSVPNNGMSNDSKPMFSGTGVTSGDLITIYDNAIAIGSVTVTSNGSWRFSPSSALSEGSHAITYTMTDKAGNQSVASSASHFTLDLSAPTALVTITAISEDTDIAGDFITSDTSLNIQGTVSGLGSNERVQISVDNGLSWSDVSLNATSWSYADSRTLSNGSYVYQVRVVDAAGNSSAVSNKTVTIDTSLTNTAIAITSISDDTGMSGDFITRDNVLSVNGTVSNLSVGQKAQISLDDGQSWIDLTINNNTWNYNDSRVLSDGNVIYRVRVVNSDSTIVTATAAQQVTIDSTAPTAPTTVAIISDDQRPVIGNVANNTATNDNQPTISGVGQVGDTVLIYNSNSLIASTTVAADGKWSYTPSSVLSDATYNITYSYKDVAGNETVQSGNVKFIIDSTLPTTPSAALVVTDGLAPVTGNVSNGGSSNDTTPSLSGTGVVAGDVIHIYDQDILIASVVAVANGSWSYTPTTALGEGSHRFSYTVTDAASNQSQASPITVFIVDTALPSASIQFVSISDDSGIAGDFKTSDTSISLNGKVTNLANDEHLQISIDGGNNWLDLTVNSGSWTYVDSRTLSNGNFSYQVRAIDAAGNAGTAVSKVVTIDSTLPKAAVTINNINDDTGAVGDYITSDSTITLNGSATNLATGEKLQISVDNGQTWVSLTVNNDSWSYSDTRILQDASYTYQLRVVNSSNTPIGVTESKTITIDTVAPDAPTTVPTLTDNQAPNIGNLANNAVTNDTQPTMSGSGVAANTVIAILDNGSVIGSTTANANGAWSFKPNTPLSEGAHSISYAITDLAANQSAASPVVNITVDSTAPVLNINISSISDDTGNAGDFLTADNTLTLNGSVTGLATGETLQISIDGTTWTNLVVSNNAWSYTDSRILDNGTYTYQVRGMDSAGNVSNAVSRQVTVDTNAPTAAIQISSISNDTGTASDFITNDTNLTVNGRVTGLVAGQKAQISTDNGVNWQNLTVDNSNWSFSDPRTLTTGSYAYLVRVVNGAETAVGATASQTVIIDTAAPTYSSQIQIVRDSNDDGFINTTEQGGSTTTDVNIVISPSAQTGDVITVKNGSTVLATYVVGQDGATAGATKLITGISLPSEGNSLTITAETRDIAGNLSNVISSDIATMNSSATNPALQSGTSVADTFNSNSNNNWFEGREGNDVFNLGAAGGQDTLFYKLLTNDATGGNGSDTVNNFGLGNTQSNNQADKIDLKELLLNYSADADGAAHFVNGVATIDSGDNIAQYLSVVQSSGSSTLYIDRDGTGTAFSATALLTLTSTSVDLATLLANHQIIIG